jgi:hypothetical protein
LFFRHAARLTVQHGFKMVAVIFFHPCDLIVF